MVDGELKWLGKARLDLERGSDKIVIPAEKFLSGTMLAINSSSL